MSSRKDNQRQDMKSTSGLLYRIDDKPPISVSILLGFQNIIAAFGGIVAVPLVIAGALKLPIQDTAFLVSAAIFVAGIATFIQARGFGKSEQEFHV